MLNSSPNSLPLDATTNADVDAPKSWFKLGARVGTSRLVATRNGGANWFFWIVGVSVVNTLVSLLTTHPGSLALGLGGTLFIDMAISELIAKSELPPAARAVGLGMDALIFAFYVFCGRQARAGQSWAFLLGGWMFVLDTLLVVLLESWIGVAFHAWAIALIFLGWHANKSLRAQSAAPNIA